MRIQIKNGSGLLSVYELLQFPRTYYMWVGVSLYRCRKPDRSMPSKHVVVGVYTRCGINNVS